MNKSVIARGAVALAFAIPAFAFVQPAGATPVDAAKSSVSATFKQMGVPVDGAFRKFTGDVSYDPAKPAEAKARIDIDISGFDIGDPEYNKEVLKKEWFNAAQYPKASFVTTAVKPAGAGKFDATGTLTIKGKTQTLTVPVTVAPAAGANVFSGALPIKRLAYDIGEGDWKDTGMVADEVVIKFKLAVPAGK
ncbi:YceI family protein [Derxia gummosa]|uniref:YceI family protein n=1 Tax=Derxia gummosa DSM 723 TaxID=1121388 RepID=A0A8B6X6V5_9BURK|nr:YceI family protein [Derxia gummosa]